MGAVARAGSLHRVVAVASLGAACGRPPVVAPPPPAPPPAKECVEAGRLRAEVDGLVAQGKLDRTVRVIHEADLLCPASSGESRLPLLRALVDLDRTDAASEVAHAVLGAAHTPAEDTEAREALRRIAERDAEGETSDAARLDRLRALFFQAQGARGTPDGQRLLDRGVAGVERFAGPMRLDVRPPAYGGAAWLPDGRLVVALGERQSRIVRLDSGQETPLDVDPWVLATHDPPRPPQPSPDGRFVLVDAARDTIGLYRTDTGAVVRMLAAGAAGARWSPDSRWLAWPHAGGTTIELLSMDPRGEFELTPARGKLGPEHVAGVVVTRQAVVARTLEGRLHVWERASRRWVGAVDGLATTSHGLREREHERLEASDDGAVVAVWLDGGKGRPEIALVDVRTARVAARLHDPGCVAHTFAMHPSRPELAVGSDGVVCFWDTTTRRLVRRMRPQIFPPGAGVARGMTPEAKKAIDALPFELLRYEGKVPRVALAVVYVLGWTRFEDDGSKSPPEPDLRGLSPDGRYAADCASTAQGGPCRGGGSVVEVATGRVVRRFGEHERDAALRWTGAGLTRVGEQGTSSSWGPDGFVGALRPPPELEPVTVVTSPTQTLLVHASPSGLRAAFVGPVAVPFSLPVPPGSVVASPGGPATMLSSGLWALSRDARRLAFAGPRGMVVVWDLETRGLLATLAAAGASSPGSSAHGIALSPDGAEVAVLEDKKLLRWDVASGRPLDGPADAVFLRVLYGAGAPALVTAREDGTLESWARQAAPRVSVRVEGGGSDAWETAAGVVVRTRAGLAVVDLATKAQHAVPLEHPETVWTVTSSPDGRWLAVARSPGGDLDFLRANDGGHRVTLHALPDDGAAVLQDDHGLVELLPDSPRTRALLACHAGEVELPAEACEERLVTRGAWRALLGGR